MMQFVEEETDKYASKIQKVNLFFFHVILYLIEFMMIQDI